MRVLGPRGAATAAPAGELWHYDPDACCTLRMVAPLEEALTGFDAWVSGRKRHLSITHAELPFTERMDGRL